MSENVKEIDNYEEVCSRVCKEYDEFCERLSKKPVNEIIKSGKKIYFYQAVCNAITSVEDDKKFFCALYKVDGDILETLYEDCADSDDVCFCTIDGALNLIESYCKRFDLYDGKEMMIGEV